MPRLVLPVLAAILIAVPRPTPGLDTPAPKRVEFERDVRPILAKHCFSCHGPDKHRGGLRLDRKTDALKGGDGGPVIVPGKAAASPLVRLASGLEPDRQMPPK